MYFGYAVIRANGEIHCNPCNDVQIYCLLFVKRRRWLIGKKTKLKLGEAELEKVAETNFVSNQMCLRKGKDEGICFGVEKAMDSEAYVGIRQGTEGNIVVIGGNGSGKSLGIVMPTLGTWGGALCVTDVKGELSTYYKKLYHQGVVKRPYIIFDPLRPGGKGYDPFYSLGQVPEEDYVRYIWEMALAIHPLSADDIQPFWRETEQGILAGVLLYYFKQGLSFSQTMIMMVSSTVTEMVQKIQNNGGEQEKMFLGEVKNMKPENLAALDRGLRNSLMLFANDPYVNQAFRGKREGADCFTWDDLDKYNIFLCVSEDQIEQWGRMINLMYTQLIRHLERRPDKYSEKGVKNMQTLLLMDEFARFGRLEIITNAISTLRSKCVNICLVIQSMAQFDKTYGVNDRRIIMDNCQYQAILRVNDAETQRYCCELVGKQKGMLRSYGENWDEKMKHFSYNRQVSETYEYLVQPHEFATLQKILLLTPLGLCCIDKIKTNIWEVNHKCAQSIIIRPTEVVVRSSSDDKQYANIVQPVCVWCVADEDMMESYEGVEKMEMPSIEERVKEVKEKVRAIENEKRLAAKREREDQEIKNKRRNYLIGELVSKYFPEVISLEVGNRDENAVTFKPLEAFLAVLSEDKELMASLKERAEANMEVEDVLG